jgi:hypothetical protein
MSALRNHKNEHSQGSLPAILQTPPTSTVNYPATAASPQRDRWPAPALPTVDQRPHDIPGANLCNFWHRVHRTGRRRPDARARKEWDKPLRLVLGDRGLQIFVPERPVRGGRGWQRADVGQAEDHACFLVTGVCLQGTHSGEGIDGVSVMVTSVVAIMNFQVMRCDHAPARVTLGGAADYQGLG